MKHRILFVDDEEINLFIMTKRFEKEYDVSTVNSPLEALKMLEKDVDKYKVVVTDLRMPDMNGLDFVSKAKELYPMIHFFLLTGYEYNKEIDDAMKSKRVTRLFGKPFDFDEMNNAIAECL